MAEPKTRPTKASVEKFLRAITEEERQADCRKITAIMEKATKAKPKMWGPSIIGFGEQPLKYASGKELDWPVVAFSPRKEAITLYLTFDFDEHKASLAKLGKHKTGKCCLYVKRLSDIDVKVLTTMVKDAVAKGKK